MLTSILTHVLFFILGFVSACVFYRLFKKEGFKFPKINLKHPLRPKVIMEAKSDIQFISPAKLQASQKFLREVEEN